MAGAVARAEDARRMSGSDFRAFQEQRPDHERWELIDGAPVMMTPPLIDHNRIASNLERLLNDALERHDRSREAVQRPGIELGLSAEVLSRLGLDAEYKPEPDVAVIDHDPRPGRRFVDRAYLLAEVASSTDDGPLLATGEPWIEAKTRLYRAHPSCEAVVVVEQQRVVVRLATRTGEGWAFTRSSRLDDPFVLAAFGLTCRVADLYAGTCLHPRAR
jgi:Uma2 family endonuclease